MSLLSPAVVFFFSCLFVLFLIIVLIPFFSHKREKEYVKQHMEYKSHRKHTAIIFIQKEPDDHKRLFLNGVSWLLRHYRKNSTSYKVYLWVSRQEFKEIIANPMVTRIYVFGHGTRYGVRFGTDLFEYSHLSARPKKYFIGQFHCNGWKYGLSYFGSKPSLADVLHAEKSNVTRWLRFAFCNYWHFWVIYHGLKKEY